MCNTSGLTARLQAGQRKAVQPRQSPHVANLGTCWLRQWDLELTPLGCTRLRWSGCFLVVSPPYHLFPVIGSCFSTRYLAHSSPCPLTLTWVPLDSVLSLFDVFSSSILQWSSNTSFWSFQLFHLIPAHQVTGPFPPCHCLLLGKRQWQGVKPTSFKKVSVCRKEIQVEVSTVSCLDLGSSPTDWIFSPYSAENQTSTLQPSD